MPSLAIVEIVFSDTFGVGTETFLSSVFDGKTENGLSISNGKTSLSPTIAHRKYRIPLGDFLSSSLKTITATIKKDAVMLRLRIFSKSAVSLFLLKIFDHLFDLVNLIIG